MQLASQHRVYICFFIFAGSVGALLARMPDLQAALQVDKSELGLTLIGLAIGSLISLTFSSPLIAHLGARTTAFITVLGVPAIVAVIPWLHSAPIVFCALFCQGLLAGAAEINLSVEIDRIEAQLGRRIMNRAHGFWSLGFFVTALIASGVRQLGISMHLHLAVTLLIVLIVGSWSISGMRNAPVRSTVVSAKAPIVAIPTIGLLPLCMMGVGAFLIEGAGVDWSTIYMRETFSVEPLVQGFGISLFTFFMALSRLFIDPIVDRFGPRLVATILQLVIILGIASVWAAPHPYVALFGFALMGAGCSAIFPLVVSAAAQRTDRPAQLNVASIAQMSFVIFFLGPPILGFIAQHLGIRTSYLACLPIIVVALLSVGALDSGLPKKTHS